MVKATSATPGRLAERLVVGSCVGDDLVADSNDLLLSKVVGSIKAYLRRHRMRGKVSGHNPEQRRFYK